MAHMEPTLTELAEQVYHNLREQFPDIPAQRFGRLISLSLGGPVLMILTVLSAKKMVVATHIRFGMVSRLFLRERIQKASARGRRVVGFFQEAGVEVQEREA